MTDPTEILVGLGLDPGEVVGQGAEGVVLALDDATVAKVWHESATARAEAAGATLAAIAAVGLPFATPELLAVHDVDGTTVTVERRLPGRELGRAHDADGSPLVVDDRRIQALGDVLAGLASVHPSPAMAGLPPLPGEPAPLRSWPDLVVRRAQLARAPLASRITDLDRVVAATVGALETLPPHRDRLVHGDLVPMNAHVDEDRRVVAVLDFGFLTCVGDPALDVALTASIFDMYGPRHRTSERLLDEAFAERFGHDPRRIGVHRAAYALATATVFSPTGEDGHFDWCVTLLQRADVRVALDL